MTNRLWIGVALLLIIPGLLFTASCAKKTVQSDPGMAAGAGAKDLAAEDEARQRAMEEQRLEEERLREEASVRRERAEREAFGSTFLYFEYDKARLLPEAKAILKSKAKWLLANSGVNVIVEGHCDDRGSNEYNMALGDRRAQSARNYLVDLGVPARRLTTISYGEEKPVAFGQKESAWAKNRRVQFVIE